MVWKAFAFSHHVPWRKKAGNKGLVPFFHIFFSYDEYYE